MHMVEWIYHFVCNPDQVGFPMSSSRFHLAPPQQQHKHNPLANSIRYPIQPRHASIRPANVLAHRTCASSSPARSDPVCVKYRLISSKNFGLESRARDKALSQVEEPSNRMIVGAVAIR